MNKFSLITFFCVIVILAAFSLSAADTTIRTWTNTEGQSVDAKYIGLQGSKAIFQRADGAKLGIDITSLQEVDRKLVLDMAKKAGQIPDEGTGATYQESPNKLPSFSDGRWKDNHTVYQGKTYVARIDNTGMLYVQPQVDGKDLGPVISQGFGIGYIDPERQRGRQHVRRNVVKFLEHPEPARLSGKKTEIEFKAILDDDVEFVRTIEFEANEVTAHLEVADPSKITYPSYFGYNFHCRQSIKPAQYDSLEELKQLTDGWELKIKQDKGGRETYPFWKSMSNIYGVVECEAVGPWGERVVTFETPPEKEAFSHFHVYSGMAPVDRFSFGRTTNIDTSDEVEYTIEID